MPRARTLARLDSVEIANLLTESGPVARVLGTTAFEDRPGQRDMAAYIADVYNDGGIALLEAGTGVGKSFAYLVPALEWARLNGERTVVSTNTINLQEQLVGKDLPICRAPSRRASAGVTFALLKGWRNYLCLSRLEQARAGQDSLFDEGRGPSSSRSRDGPRARPMEVSPISSRSPPATCGMPSPPSRTSARASNARTSIAALYSPLGVAQPKPTSSS